MICVDARISEVPLTCPSLWGSSGSHPVFLLGKSGVFEPFLRFMITFDVFADLFKSIATLCI